MSRKPGHSCDSSRFMNWSNAEIYNHWRVTHEDSALEMEAIFRENEQRMKEDEIEAQFYDELYALYDAFEPESMEHKFQRDIAWNLSYVLAMGNPRMSVGRITEGDTHRVIPMRMSFYRSWFVHLWFHIPNVEEGQTFFRYKMVPRSTPFAEAEVREVNIVTSSCNELDKTFKDLVAEADDWCLSRLFSST